MSWRGRFGSGVVEGSPWSNSSTELRSKASYESGSEVGIVEAVKS